MSAFLIVNFSSHIARVIAMKCVVDCVAMEGEHHTAIQCTLPFSVPWERYANHKVNGHLCGLACKPAIAVTPLATAWNAISEAMNILHVWNVRYEALDVVCS